MWEIHSKQLNSVHLYLYQFVSNSHLLVLCREQRHFKSYGTATNWNNTGYFEVGHSVCKYRVKVLTNCVIISPGQCNDKRQQNIFI